MKVILNVEMIDVEEREVFDYLPHEETMYIRSVDKPIERSCIIESIHGKRLRRGYQDENGIIRFEEVRIGLSNKAKETLGWMDDYIQRIDSERKRLLEENKDILDENIKLRHNVSTIKKASFIERVKWLFKGVYI